MLKKIVVCAVMTCATQSVLATTANKTSGGSYWLFNRGEKTYIGGGLGISELGVHGGRPRIYDVGASARLFAGEGSRYGVERNVYLAKELNIDVFHLPNLDGGKHISYGLGGSLLPGYYIFSNTMAYGRVGVEAYHSRSSTGLTTQLGVGLDHELTKKVNLRAEYTSFGAGGYHLPKSEISFGLSYQLD